MAVFYSIEELGISSFFKSRPSTEWLQSSLLAKGALVNLEEKAPIYFSVVDTKYTDTTLGGNFAINPPPQWTRSADIKRRGRGAYGSGMGRAYGERIDENSQIVYMRAGVATFNSLSTFVSSFYNPEMGNMARAGRGTNFFFQVGKVAGFVVNVMAWKLQAMQIIGKAVSFYLEKGTTRFYRLKPTMPVYWQTVQNIVNQLAVNVGASPRAIADRSVDKGVLTGYQFTNDDAKRLQEAFPGLFTSMGSIDVWAMANRSQRMYINQMRAIDEHYATYEAGIRDALENDIQAIYTGPVNDPGDTVSYQEYFQRWIESSGGNPGDLPLDADGQITGASVETINSVEKDPVSFLKFYEAELYDGSAFVGFRVNYTGSVQESVSNQTGESDLAAELNNYSSQARSVSFKLAGGNIMPGVKEVADAAFQVASGALDTLGLSGVLNMAVGGTFVDIPLQWKSSMMQLPRSTYTIDLVSPYNHPIAKLMYQYIPMAMLIAAAFPRSTGRQSYYSPPMIEFYDQGRSQTRLGMIDSLTFERGITNLGFNHANRAMGIRATFSVADMSNIIHVPISMTNSLTSVVGGFLVGGVSKGILNAVKELGKEIYDDDTAFNDYMAVIAGLGVAEQVFTWRKSKLRATRALMNWENWTSPARIANVVGDWMPSRLLSAFYPVPNKLGN